MVKADSLIVVSKIIEKSVEMESLETHRCAPSRFVVVALTGFFLTLFVSISCGATRHSALRIDSSSPFVSAEKVAIGMEESVFALVDIREEQTFGRYHISGSLNVPGYAIKTKDFLRNKHVVLVNEGYSTQPLKKLCENLLNASFSKVSILKGGLNYWRQKIGPLEGDLIAQRTVNKITSPQFFEVKDHGNWSIVNISSSAKSKNKAFPDARTISLDEDPTQIRRAVESVVKKGTGARDPMILIVSEDGEHYERVEHALEGSDIVNVFYLEGGSQAYEQLLKRRSVMLNKIPGKKKTVKGCSSCP